MTLNISTSGYDMIKLKQRRPRSSPIPPDYRAASLFKLWDSSIVPQHSIKRYIKVRICTRWQALRITVMTGLILICHTVAAVLNWDCFIINQKGNFFFILRKMKAPNGRQKVILVGWVLFEKRPEVWYLSLKIREYVCIDMNNEFVSTADAPEHIFPNALSPWSQWADSQCLTEPSYLLIAWGPSGDKSHPRTLPSVWSTHTHTHTHTHTLQSFTTILPLDTGQTGVN